MKETIYLHARGELRSKTYSDTMFVHRFTLNKPEVTLKKRTIENGRGRALFHEKSLEC